MWKLMAVRLIWIGVVVLFAVMEAATAALVSVWFALGAVAGLLACVFGFTVLQQIEAFVLVSALALAATRPLVRRYAAGGVTPTNADRVLGRVGRVTETVDDEAGAVYVDGKTWSARTEEGPIPPESHVLVERIEGVKLYVSRT